MPLASARTAQMLQRSRTVRPGAGSSFRERRADENMNPKRQGGILNESFVHPCAVNSAMGAMLLICWAEMNFDSASASG
jgi:hypothetical protein